MTEDDLTSLDQIRANITYYVSVPTAANPDMRATGPAASRPEAEDETHAPGLQDFPSSPRYFEPGASSPSSTVSWPEVASSSDELARSLLLLKGGDRLAAAQLLRAAARRAGEAGGEQRGVPRGIQQGRTPPAG